MSAKRATLLDSRHAGLDPASFGSRVRRHWDVETHGPRIKSGVTGFEGLVPFTSFVMRADAGMRDEGRVAVAFDADPRHRPHHRRTNKKGARLPGRPLHLP